MLLLNNLMIVNIVWLFIVSTETFEIFRLDLLWIDLEYGLTFDAAGVVGVIVRATLAAVGLALVLLLDDFAFRGGG